MEKFSPKLTVTQLIKKFSAFYGSRIFTTVFARARHLSLLWARLIKSTPCHPISPRFVQILLVPSHLWLGAPNHLFPSVFPTKSFLWKSHLFMCATKVKFSPCFNWAPRHEGVLGEWRYRSTHSLTSALDGGEWSASRPAHFTPRERAPGTHWIGGWVCPRAVLDAVVLHAPLIPSSLQIFCTTYRFRESLD
jgi:hypothetical protein